MSCDLRRSFRALRERAVFREDRVAPISLLTEHQCAERLGVSISTVRRMRRTNTGPSYFRIGRLVRYRHEDVECFISERIQREEVAR
jgi:excisionase family DNA binding protein